MQENKPFVACLFIILTFFGVFIGWHLNKEVLIDTVKKSHDLINCIECHLDWSK